MITNWLIWNANAKKSSPTLLIETRLPARFSRNARHFPTRSLLPSSASHTRDLDRGHRPAPSSCRRPPPLSSSLAPALRLLPAVPALLRSPALDLSLQHPPAAAARLHLPAAPVGNCAGLLILPAVHAGRRCWPCHPPAAEARLSLIRHRPPHQEQALALCCRKCGKIYAFAP